MEQWTRHYLANIRRKKEKSPNRKKSSNPKNVLGLVNRINFFVYVDLPTETPVQIAIIQKNISRKINLQSCDITWSVMFIR